MDMYVYLEIYVHGCDIYSNSNTVARGGHVCRVHGVLRGIYLSIYLSRKIDRYA